MATAFKDTFLIPGSCDILSAFQMRGMRVQGSHLVFKCRNHHACENNYWYFFTSPRLQLGLHSIAFATPNFTPVFPHSPLQKYIHHS